MSGEHLQKCEPKDPRVRLDFFQLSEGVMSYHLSPCSKFQGLDRILTGTIREAKQVSVDKIHGQVIQSTVLTRPRIRSA